MTGPTDGGVPDGVETVADLFAGGPVEPPPAGPADDAPALSVADEELPVAYDGAGLRADVRKTANLLAHLGARSGRTLAVADEGLPQPAIAVFAASLLGAVVRFVSPDGGGSLDARAVLAPGDGVGAFDLPAGGQAIGYGTDPDDPRATYFEKEMWSENPTVPPPRVDPADPLLSVDGEGIAQGELVARAGAVREAHDLAPGDRVAVRAPFRAPGTVVAGLLAPTLAGAEVVLARGIDRPVGGLAVAAGSAPEERVIAPGDA